MQTLVFATCKFNAKDTQSQYGPEFTTLVTMHDSTEQRLYWKAGGVADYLQSGDVVAVEFYKGKWRLSRTQAPELLEKLEARHAQTPTTTTHAAAPRQTTTIEDDCDQMVRIFSHIRRSLPQTPDECIQSMACTIWIQRNKR